MPILATVIIALSLMVATIITLIGRGGEDEPGPGPVEAGGGNTDGLLQPPLEPPEPPIGSILCAPDGDAADGLRAKDGASPQPGEALPSGLGDAHRRLRRRPSWRRAGKPESCDGRDNDLRWPRRRGFEDNDRNSDSHGGCAERPPPSASTPTIVLDGSGPAWVRRGEDPQRLRAPGRPRLDGAGAGDPCPRRIAVENGHARCGVPIAPETSPEGAPLCGLPALSIEEVNLSSESAQIEWRCYEGPKSRAGQGQRDACHVVGGNVVTQQM
ncbi:MAG: hypothetical protein IPO67_30725 [Deltaproteobacteria bacterium]|nr:hypothetical protein [Deltaproteobacteria bacterium]